MKIQIKAFLHKENSCKKIVNTNSKKVELYKLIKKHGDNLKKIFNLDKSIDSIKLCKSLFRLENKAQKLTLDFANGVIDQNYFDKKIEPLLIKVENILNVLDQPIFVNNDPRGYAFKISDTYVKNKEIFKDWGGYGIIAPDLTGYLVPYTPPFDRWN